MSYRITKYKRAILWTFRFSITLPEKLLYYFGFKLNTQQIPDFLIIGLPKAATWWLAHLLRSHPQFYLGVNPEGPGEVRYFSKYFDKPLSWYFRIFENQNKFVKFEKSPDYCILSSFRVKLIKKLNPDIKIILLFREPIEWSFSHAKMDLLRKRNMDFDEVDFNDFKKHYNLNARKYDYERISSLWHRFFDQQHLLIICQDEIKRKPMRVIEKVHEFLNVSFEPKHYPDLSPRNTTQKIKVPENHCRYLEQINAKNIAFYKKKILYQDN